MAPMKLYYFDLPGRAEAARLLLTLGKADFEDKRIAMNSSEWSEKMKPNMPFGQVPVLEVEGKMLTQTMAIDRYCAAITGVLPADPLTLALAEQAYCFIDDIWEPIGIAMGVEHSPTASEGDKQVAWQELIAPDGKFKERLATLDKFLAKRPGKYLAGDSWCHADLSVFSSLSLFQSGWMKAMPTDILSPYAALKAFRHMIASIPEVTEYYSKQANDPTRCTGFLPDGSATAATAEPAAA